MKHIVSQQAAIRIFCEMFDFAQAPRGFCRDDAGVFERAALFYGDMLDHWHTVEDVLAEEIRATYPNFYFPFGTHAACVPSERILRADGSRILEGGSS